MSAGADVVIKPRFYSLEGCRMDRACSCREGPANSTAAPERHLVLACTAFRANAKVPCLSLPTGGGYDWRSGMVVPDMHEI